MANRIDPALVAVAYRTTGLIPVQGWSGSMASGTACGLSAVCVAAGRDHPSGWIDPWWLLSRELELAPEYVRDFTDGFDGHPGDSDGYADGHAAWALVSGEDVG
ncbi:MAG TPA: hypothetical protein VFW75_05985 [Acetobacteraceae bacterium]|nr:hypothetical protein [Acetobacteraceae bacterium]